MSRILIAFATRGGATSQIAGLLAKELRHLDHDVVVKPAVEALSPEGFDHFIVGSGIAADRWYPEGIGWLKANADALRGRLSIFAVSLTASDPGQHEKALAYTDQAAEIVEPVERAAFAGRYAPDKSSWLGRMLMRIMGHQEQDHVDAEAVEAWGREIAERHLKQG